MCVHIYKKVAQDYVDLVVHICFDPAVWDDSMKWTHRWMTFLEVVSSTIPINFQISWLTILPLNLTHDWLVVHVGVVLD